MMEQVKEKEASQLVSDIVAFGMMLPIIAAGVAISIGMIGAAARYALFGEIPPIGEALATLDGQTLLLVMAAVGLAYWVVFNYLFGENVQDTLDQAEDAKDTVDEEV